MTVACSGELYAVHKLVLSSCSDYFFKILQNVDCPKPVVVLNDIIPENFEALLSYMYLGEVNVLQDNLQSLLKASEQLGIKGLAGSKDDDLKQNSNSKLHQETPVVIIEEKNCQEKSQKNEFSESSRNRVTETNEEDTIISNDEEMPSSVCQKRKLSEEDDDDNEVSTLSVLGNISMVDDGTKRMKVSLPENSASITELHFPEAQVDHDLSVFESRHFENMVCI